MLILVEWVMVVPGVLVLVRGLGAYSLSVFTYVLRGVRFCPGCSMIFGWIMSNFRSFVICSTFER